MCSARVFVRGFTLLELLVVVAIVGSLLGLTTLSIRPSRATEIRQAAQSVASLLLQTQSQALSSDSGSAITLSSAGIFAADITAGIIGNVTAGSIVSGTAATIQSDIGAVDNVYQARFIPLATTSGTATPISPWYVTTTGTSLFFGASQTPNNTIWPVWMNLGTPPRCSVEYRARPTASFQRYKWPTLATIDFRYSGFSGEAGLGPDVTIVFSSTGQPQTLFTGSLSVEIGKPLYLLLAAETDVTSNIPFNSLLTDESIWVALDPNTGKTAIARNVPVTITGPITEQQLAEARSNIYTRPGFAR